MCKERTEFIRLCPKCGREQFYKYEIGLENANERNNQYCVKCALKCRTYEDIYGEEKAKVIKRKHSLSTSGKNNHRFGKTNIEYFGEERAKEIGQKISKATSGEKNGFFGKHHSEETKSKIRKNLKNQNGEKNGFFGKHHSEETKSVLREKRLKQKDPRTGKYHSIKSRRKMRVSRKAYIEKQKLNGGQIKPNYNHHGCEYFNWVAEQTGTYIQHAENDKEYFISELCYWVDGYDIENNIVYEYDEPHHYNPDGTLKDKDAQRQKEITEFLNCIFVRIKQ